MRTRGKQRIYRRFYAGESVYDLSIEYHVSERAIEDIIREGHGKNWDSGKRNV